MGGTFESICTCRASRSYGPESDNELRPILLHATNEGGVSPVDGIMVSLRTEARENGSKMVSLQVTIASQRH